MWTIILLILSNIFMTVAWYGHLKFFKGNEHSMWMIISFSWGIALFEYCLMVPANRLGKSLYGWETVQLKTMQEVITLVVFAFFSILVLKENFKLNHAIGFALIALGAFFIFNPFATKESNKPVARVLEGSPSSTYTEQQDNSHQTKEK